MHRAKRSKVGCGEAVIVNDSCFSNSTKIVLPTDNTRCGCMTHGFGCRSVRLVCRDWRHAVGSSVTHLAPSALPTKQLTRLFPLLKSLDLGACLEVRLGKGQQS